MASIIIVGRMHGTTTMLHQPYEGAVPASITFPGDLTVGEVCLKALAYFGVDLDEEYVVRVQENARPSSVILKGQPYSYAVVERSAQPKETNGVNNGRTLPEYLTNGR